ncbi:AmmeMemoRadiSam system protein B [Patescibacteria group bacterium]|nr:AmmeMemoRadiSam system protein B [Patescibacteria group bacterium]
MWQNIFVNGESYTVPEKPLSVILPHHMVTAFQLAGVYQSLSAFDYSTIFILGPNHFENGNPNIQTCFNCIYETNEGPVQIDLQLAKKMVGDGVTARLDKSFQDEHAIHSHTPFIKHYFPEAKIVPVLFQWETPTGEVEEFATWLNENLPENALVIASVDFSHYIQKEAADFHDLSSLATINNFDFLNVYDLEIDSPASIYALLKVMQSRGYQKATRLDHTNLDDYLSSPAQETTSHQYFTFTKGQITPIKGISVMFVNFPLDLELLDAWHWNRKGESLLPEIAGKEDRFLMGSDFYVFNLGKGCKYKSQNSLTIAFCQGEEPTQQTDFTVVSSGEGITINGVIYQFEKDNFGAYLTEDGVEVFRF